MRLTIFLLATALFFMTSCDEESNADIGEGTPRTKIDIDLDSVQVVLTNEYAFNDGRYAIGAASFLLQGEKGTFLCTAKHLLGEAMGISPSVKTADFESVLSYWRAFSTDKSMYSDSVLVNGLVNKKVSQTDILLLRHEGVGEGLEILKPRFSKPKLNEELELIANEYNSDGQQRFSLVVDKFNRSSYIVRAKDAFNPRAMSGSPVLDKNGYVIGVLIGGGHFEGELYLTVEPLSLVKNYLD